MIFPPQMAHDLALLGDRPDEYFSSSYPEARQKFLEAAKSRSATIESIPHPRLRGPEGEELAVDVAELGGSTVGRVLMIVSGTHGVEGYAGSGCQVHLLHSDLLMEISRSMRIVLVHAINPYGFAYNRRTNEDNIDLNRNFIDFSTPPPINPNYMEYANRFLPQGKEPSDYQTALASLDAEAKERGGYQFLKKALQPGQYAHPQGLYYGGASPCWSNRLFMRICRSHLAVAQRAAVLDVHTGLGPHAVGELIFMRKDGAERYAHLFSPPVSCAGGAASVSAAVKGPLVNAACDVVQGEIVIGCALEFGTVPVKENTQAMIFENWTYRYLSAENPLYQQSSQGLKQTYYCNTPLWKQAVIARCAKIIGQLRECLLEE
jgi:hypothetical protein